MLILVLYASYPSYLGLVCFKASFITYQNVGVIISYIWELCLNIWSCVISDDLGNSGGTDEDMVEEHPTYVPSSPCLGGRFHDTT